MGKALELSGQTFGRLTVMERSERIDGSGSRFWKCRCECGNLTEVKGSSLVNGDSQSCGCRHRDIVAEVGRRMATHGGRRKGNVHPLYNTWSNIRRRCFDPKCPEYKFYGARGISMCDAWRNDFAAFVAGVGERPEGHSIERIDNDGNYEPGNVRWATQREQASNTRKNRRITYNGETLTLAEWCRRTGLTHRCLGRRLDRGWSVEDALTRDVKV